MHTCCRTEWYSVRLPRHGRTEYHSVLRRLFIRRSFAWVLPPLLIAALYAPVAAQDTLYYSSDPAGQGYTKLEGRVIDYSGQELLFEPLGATVRQIPAEHVLRIDTQFDPRKAQADEAFAQGDFSLARSLYASAREAESDPARRWVRELLTARLVWCYRANGSMEAAGEEFLGLVPRGRTTPYFDCIPLAWSARGPHAGLERAADNWLRREDSPAAQLMGASHLLSTRPEVLARLQRLATSADPRVAQLALAQTWRSSRATVDERRLTTWQTTIERMPESLRGGPYYALSLAWANSQNWSEAAMAAMRVPVLYPSHRALSARALVDSGRYLERLNQPEQALGLYREALARYPKARAAAEAKSRMEQVMDDA